MLNREAIFSALAAKLATAAGLVTFSRKLVHIQDVAPELMPYGCMVCGDQVVEQRDHLPPRYLFPVDFYLYVAEKGTDLVPQVVLNNMLDAIDAVIEPLGGLNYPEQVLGIARVKHVRVQGKIATDEGTLGDRAVAVIPIEIVVA